MPQQTYPESRNFLPTRFLSDMACRIMLVAVSLGALVIPAKAQIHTGGGVTNFSNPGFGVAGGLKFNSSGYAVLADYHNNQVIEIRPDGSAFVAISSSDINAYVSQLGPGAGNGSTAATIDNQGNVYVGLPSHILKKTPSGVKSLIDLGTEAWWNAYLSQNPYYYALPPTDLAVDSAGNLYASSAAGNTVIEVPADGSGPFALSSSLGFSTTVYGIAVDSQGRVYVCDPAQGVVQVLYPNSNGYTQYFSLDGADMSDLEYVAVDSQNNIYLSGFTRGLHTIYEVSGGYLQGGPPNLVTINIGQNQGVFGLAVDQNDNLYAATFPPGGGSGYPQVYINKLPNRVFDFGNVTAPVTPSYTSNTTSLTFTYPNGLPQNTNPPVVVSQNGSAEFQASGWSCTNAVPSLCSLTLAASPLAAGTRTGTLLLPDASAGKWDIFPLHMNGIAPLPVLDANVAILAAPASDLVGQSAVSGAGNLVFANTSANSIQAINSLGSAATTLSFSSPATSPLHPTASAALNSPSGVAKDGLGNLFIADSGNNRVLVYHPGNGADLAVGSYYFYQLPTPGTTLNNPTALATDGFGNLYIVDSGNSRVLKILNAGEDAANLAAPSCVTFSSTIQDIQGIAVDAAGNVYLASPQNSAVFKLDTTGAILSVMRSAGSFTLQQPTGVAVDPAGTLYIADIGQPEGQGLLELTAAGVGTVYNTPLWSVDPSGVSIDPVNGDLYLSVSAGSGGSGLYRVPRANPSLTFQTTAINNTSSDSPQPFVLENAGSGNLTLNSIVFATDFPNGGSGSGTCSTPLLIAPGHSCSGSVSFKPTSASTLTENVQFTENGSNITNGVQNLSVTGPGVNGGQAQTISFTTRASTTTYSILQYLFFTSSSSGLPVTVRVISGPGNFNGSNSAVVSTGGIGMNELGAGTVVLEADQAGNSIYAPATPVRLSVKINPATLSVKIYSATEVYGSGQPVLNCLLQAPYHSWEQASVVITGGVTASTPVGTTTVTLGLTGPSANSYVLATTSTTLTVTPAPVTVVANDAYQLAGQTPNVTGWSVQGLVNGDPQSVFTGAPSLSTSATASSPAGNYAITGSAGSVAAANYTVTAFQNGVLNIFSPINVGASPVGTPIVTEISFPAGAYSAAVGGTALTQGAQFSDFIVSGKFCQIPNSGTCSYQLKFTPSAPGLRVGAIQLFDAASPANLLVSIPVSGIGTGSSLAFSGGTTSVVADGLTGASGLAFDGSGNLYVVDQAAKAVYKTVSGVRTPLGSGWQKPSDVVVDGVGNIYVSDYNQQAVFEITPSGMQIKLPLTLQGPQGLAIDGSGDLFIADTAAGKVYEVTAAGSLSQVGSGFVAPAYLAVDASGNLYVGDYSPGNIYKITAAGNQTLLTSAVTYPEGLATDAAGTLNAVGRFGSLQSVVTVLPDGSLHTVLAESNLPYPLGIKLDGKGNLYVANANLGGNQPASQVLKLDRSDPPTVSFPTATQVGVSDTADGNQTVVLTNVGNSSLSISAISVGVNFTQATGSGTPPDCTSSTALAAAASCAIAFNFTPTVAGSITGSASITTTASSTPQSISLLGTGITETQTINFPPIGTTQVGSMFDLSATATSGLPVTFTSNTTGICTVSGNAVSANMAGNCSITASQAGNAAFQAAPSVTQTFSIVLNTQTITFGAIAPQKVGTSLNLEATASSGLPVSYSSSTPYFCSVTGAVATFLNPGTCTIVAAQSGNNTYAAASPVSQSFVVTTTTGLGYIPVKPCRVVDTRQANGPLGGPVMAAGSTRSFALPTSACGLPSNASAYSLNVTVVPTAKLNYLTLWPTGQTQPVVSTLNSPSGRTVANAAIVPAGTNGAVSVFVTDQTAVIIDVNGYFAPVGSSTLTFVPVTPCRAADTRTTTPLSANSTRSFAIPASNCSIPASAAAYSLNATVVPSVPLNYLTLYPTGGAQPLVSTLNSPTGQTVANAALVPAGASGSITAYVTNPTNLILDIDGYFTSTPPAPLVFNTVTPCRLVDTRTAAGPLGGPIMSADTVRSFPLPNGACGLPSNAAAYALNVTVVPAAKLNYLTIWPDGAPQPVVSTLNSPGGQVVANSAIVPAGTNGAVDVYVTDQAHVLIDVVGYFAAP